MINIYYVGYMGYFGWFGMILFLGVVIWIIVWLINKNKEQEPKEKTPLQIAKERYAKGELTKKKYETMSEELKR